MVRKIALDICEQADKLEQLRDTFSALEDAFENSDSQFPPYALRLPFLMLNDIANEMAELSDRLHEELKKVSV